MHHVDPSVEGCRLSEKHETAARFKLLGHPFDALEKDGLDLTCSVGDEDAQPLPVDDLSPDNRRPDLDICHVRTDVADTHIRATVHISERIYADKLTDGFGAKFPLQKCCPFGADSRKELNVCVKSVLCHTLANLMKNRKYRPAKV